MKRFITVEQFNELSPLAKEKSLNLIPRQVGSKVFAELCSTDRKFKKYDGIYEGIITKATESSIHIDYQLKGTTGSFKFLIEQESYPLFSLDELILILNNAGVEISSTDIDTLWEQVKTILEKQF